MCDEVNSTGQLKPYPTLQSLYAQLKTNLDTLGVNKKNFNPNNYFFRPRGMFIVHTIDRYRSIYVDTVYIQYIYCVTVYMSILQRSFQARHVT